MDALQKAQRIAQAIVRQHDTDNSMYTVAFEKEMLQDATLLVAVASAEAARISADAAIAQAEAMTRIAEALEALRDTRQADAIWGERAAAEAAADTASLRGMWTPVGGPFVDADGRVIVLPEGYALCRLVEPGTEAGE